MNRVWTSRRKRSLSFLAKWLLVPSALALALANASVAAEVYPSRPIRIIAPIAAGGPSDTAARLFAQALGYQLGQTVIVENRTGGGGVIGTDVAAHARPDGYTLLLSIAATFTIIPAIEKVNYNPEKDFVPLGQIWYAPQALVVSAQSKIKSVADLVSYARTNPGKLTFGSAGIGTTTYLSIMLLAREAGIKVIHVPYRGTSESLKDVLGGQIDAIFGDVSTLAPLVHAGSLTALAITAPQRSTLLPNVPTMAESGLPNVRTVNWYGLHALAGTPPAVLDRLKSAVRAAQLDAAFRAALAEHATTTGTIGAEDFAAMIHEEVQRLFPMVRSLGINLN
jgi:tripartite-type tricarboxylate transporter receptor subunit TctC